jgi:hypothetical protein
VYGSFIRYSMPVYPGAQWVLSVPKRIRPFFHHDPALAGAVLQVLLRAVRTRLRHGSPGAGPDARLGAVSFLHRFGAALNPHFHFHVVVLDGVFTEAENGEVRLDEATRFSADDAKALAPLLQRRILCLSSAAASSIRTPPTTPASVACTITLPVQPPTAAPSSPSRPSSFSTPSPA